MKKGKVVAVGYFCGVSLVGFVIGLWSADDASTMKGVISTYQTLVASFFAFLTAGAAAVLGYMKLDSDEQAHRDKLAADAEAARAKLERAGVSVLARIVAIGRRFASAAEMLQAQPDLGAMKLGLATFVLEHFPGALATCDDVVSSSWARMPDVDARAIDGLTVRLATLGAIADDARRILTFAMEIKERPLQSIDARGLDFQCWRILDNMIRLEPAFSGNVRAPARPEHRAAFEAGLARARGDDGGTGRR